MLALLNQLFVNSRRGRLGSSALLHRRMLSAAVVATVVLVSIPALRWARAETTTGTSDEPKSIKIRGRGDASAPHAPAATGKNGNEAVLPQIELINQSIRKGWTEHSLSASPPATDAEWCRRVYLDVIGRIPSVMELEKFLKSRGRNRKAELVERLLGDEYVEEYARNWTTIWTNILIGRRMQTGDNRRLSNREGMQQYLRRAFQRNKPYDQMVVELVSAKGNTKPGEPDFNGAVNFLVEKLEENGVQATAKTAQIFLGLQVQCTQCHDHPFNEWKQNRFWELNAFFRQTELQRNGERRRRPDSVTLTNGNYTGASSGDRPRGRRGMQNRLSDPKEAELYYELRKGTIAVAYPVFVDGTAINRSGYIADVDRREELAKLIVKSDYMRMAIVNRMWGHFLGYGFTKPVDDMGPHNPAQQPELLSCLATDFGKVSYDLKQLIRWIVLSEPYSLSSKMVARNKRDDPALGEKPAFSHFYTRQMTAEELYESLIVATQAEKTRGSYEQQESLKAQWLQQFTIAFGTDEGDETTTFNGTIPQALMLFNGDLIRQATSAEKGSFLDGVARNYALSNAAKIQFLYEAAIARKPTSEELTTANLLLAARKGNAVEALQDVWWALLNSNQFIMNY